jgi:hypothetical protein
MESESVEDLIDQVIAGSELPVRLPGSVRKSPQFLLVGLFALSHSLLVDLRAMGVRSRGHGGALITRSILEHVGTMHWLDEDLSDRARVFVAAGNRDLRILSRLDNFYSERYENAVTQWRSTYGPTDTEAQLPPFEQRLVGPMRDWYVRYRTLSARSHPGICAIDNTLTVAADGAVHVGQVADDVYGARWLPFAGILVWGAARLIVPEAFTAMAELGPRLNEHLVST